MSVLVCLWRNLWPFDLKTGAQCSTCHGIPSCQVRWQYDYSLWATGPSRLRLITWSCDLDLWPWMSWRLRLMQVVVLHPCTKFEVRRPWHSSDMAHDVSQCVSIILMGLVTLTFDLLTLKLVCKSHLRWGTFVPNLGTLFWFLDLFVMYATDGQTDGQKQRLLPPSLRYKGHNNSVSF